MMEPKVSVILLCFNQSAFIEESIRSVWNQDYPNVELIIIDDGSTDGSSEVIKKLLTGKEVPFLINKETLGNCAAFNKGYQISNGEYIIDLAADDIMLKTKIGAQVRKFMHLDDDFGVIYSDAVLIDGNGNSLGTHSEKVKSIGKVSKFPEGDVFEDLIRSFFISSPTMMMKRAVLDELKGYDEELNYEDFDFWVRSSRNWKYAYINQSLMVLRKLDSGMSATMHVREDPKVESTYKVLMKALDLQETKNELKVIIDRVGYEIRMAYKYKNRKMLAQWYSLYRKIGGKNPVYSILKFLG